MRFWAAFVLAFLPLLASAQPAAPNYLEGVNYARLSEPVRTADPKRIEVVEVFWYACPHCFHLEPMTKQWARTIPADVDFHYSPAIWQMKYRNPQTGEEEVAPNAVHARAYYTAKALGVLEKLHDPLFNSMNTERKRMTTEGELEALFVQNGVKAEDFRKMFNSFGVDSSVNQALARTRSYRIEGTPEFVVNGKYRVSATMAGSYENMFKVLDFLIAKERAARASATP